MIVTKEQKEKLVRLLAQGIRPVVIAKDLGIAYQTVYNYKNRLKLSAEPKPLTAGKKAAITRKLNKEKKMGKVNAIPPPLVIKNGTGIITITFEENMSANVHPTKNAIHILYK